MDTELWLAAAGYRPEDGYRVVTEWPGASPVPVVLLAAAADWQSELVARYGADYTVHEVVAGTVRPVAAAAVCAQAEALILPPTVVDEREVLRLLRVMAALRAEDGCPWDRQQTHQSLRRYLIEEAYEVAEAIDNNDTALLREELGDVLLQVAFHSQIAAENGNFTFFDVCKEISDKMISRHPHVFDKARNIGFREVMEGWEARKNKEKNRKNILEGVFWGLPSLLFACKIQEKTARIGFDWSSIEPVWEKLNEEWAEVHEAVAENDPDHIEEECGDALFASVNVIRHLGVEPETALRRTNEKFCRRFHSVEEQMRADGLNWDAVDLQQLDMYWEEAKRRERETDAGDGFRVSDSHGGR